MSSTETHENNIGFVLFSPDCTTTDLYLEAISVLVDLGLVVFDYRWVRLSSTKVAQLYSENRKNRTPRLMDKLVDQLFSMDYSLATLFRLQDKSSVINVVDVLYKAKGSSDPRKLLDYNLRYKLGATNKVMNFVHTSDSKEAIDREARLFFPLASLIGARKDEVVISEPPGNIFRQRSVHPDYCLSNLKYKLLKSVSSNLPSKISKLFHMEQNVILEYPRKGELIALLPPIKSSLFDAVTEDKQWPKIVIDTFHRLTNWDFSQDSVGWLNKRFTSLDIVVSEWEALILNCQSLEESKHG